MTMNDSKATAPEAATTVLREMHNHTEGSRNIPAFSHSQNWDTGYLWETTAEDCLILHKPTPHCRKCFAV
jgi:hypothetical protein